MGPIDKPNDEINVEEIMHNIRERIKRRRESGDYRDEDGKQERPALRDELQKDLEYINSNWDIQNNSYFISSHRRVIGKPLIKGRELVHGEVRRYVDPVILKQREFNVRIARILNEATNSINQFQYNVPGQIDEKLSQARSELSSEMEDKISHTQDKFTAEVGEQVRVVISALNEDIENKAWLAGILEKRISKSVNISSEPSSEQYDGINYFVFEDRFRGSRADIKGKQSPFINYFEGCSNVLDIGCGRGEFLEILKEHGIEGKGIDLDEDMVNFCRSKGLNVERIDAISYLNKLDDKSLDGIFIDQVVEHLDPDYLVMMLDLSYKKLIYGGAIVIETVNPISFSSFANFYIDMSHKRPVHPETLRFLLEFVGFRAADTIFLNPVSESARLKKIDFGEEEQAIKRFIEIYNHNNDILNGTLFGAQDYAIVGKK